MTTTATWLCGHARKHRGACGLPADGCARRVGLHGVLETARARCRSGSGEAGDHRNRHRHHPLRRVHADPAGPGQDRSGGARKDTAHLDAVEAHSRRHRPGAPRSLSRAARLGPTPSRGERPCSMRRGRFRQAGADPIDMGMGGSIPLSSKARRVPAGDHPVTAEFRNAGARQ